MINININPNPNNNIIRGPLHIPIPQRGKRHPSERNNLDHGYNATQTRAMCRRRPEHGLAPERRQGCARHPRPRPHTRASHLSTCISFLKAWACSAVGCATLSTFTATSPCHRPRNTVPNEPVPIDHLKDAEKHFTKSDIPFNKNSQKIRIKGNFINLLKGIREKEREGEEGS